MIQMHHPAPTDPGRLAEPREHDDLLNYRIKHLLRMGGAPAVQLCEGGYGVTRRQWRFVAALVEGGAMSPSALAERIELPRTVVSRTIIELIGKGLIERRAEGRTSAAARHTRVAASAEGRRLYAELFPRLAAINRRLMEVLDAEEVVVLDRCLTKLTAQARRILEEGAGVEVRADRRHGGSGKRWRELGHPR